MDLGTCEHAPPVSESMRPGPCLTLMLHPLRPSALKTARRHLARLGYLSIPGFTRRGRRIVRRPGRRVIAADSLLLAVASFVSDAATLVALSRCCKHTDALLARSASPLANEIWDRLLSRDFHLSAAALREAKLAHAPMAGGHVGHSAIESVDASPHAGYGSSGDCECETAGAGCGQRPCICRGRAGFSRGVAGAGAGAGAGASLGSAAVDITHSGAGKSANSGSDAALDDDHDADDDDDNDADDDVDGGREAKSNDADVASAVADVSISGSPVYRGGPALSTAGGADACAVEAHAPAESAAARSSSTTAASTGVGAGAGVGAGSRAAGADSSSSSSTGVDPSSSGGRGLPPLCASKRVYGLLVQGRGDVYRAAEARRAMEQLHRAGATGIDASVWSSVLHATGLGRFTPAAMPGFGAGGWFARWFH